MVTSRVQNAKTKDGWKICVDYRDTQRCYYMMKLGQYKYLPVDPDGKVLYDGQEAESENRWQQQKDGISGGKEKS